MAIRHDLEHDPEYALLLKAIRIKRHWSQHRLAQEIGVSVKTIRRWESGKSAPNVRDIELFRQMLLAS